MEKKNNESETKKVQLVQLSTTIVLNFFNHFLNSFFKH